MLQVYHSNRADRLADALAQLLRTPLRDPLAPERIIVQHPGMGGWLGQRLAERLGVAANIEFPLPASFVWELFAAQLPDVPERAGFDRQVLVWSVLDRLHALPGDAAYDPLRRYLGEGDRPVHAYQLALRIADLFDQYQVYRPDWILAWERGEGAHWQAGLWRLLAGDGRPLHRARLWQRFRERSEAGALRAEALPRRVSAFGVSALAPAYLDVLERLARLTEVHLLVLNPCAAWWGDLSSEREQARLRARWRRTDRPDLSAYYEAGNSLLASMGRQGRDFFDQLEGLQGASVELYEAPAGASLLARIQEDILVLRDSSSPQHGPLEVAEDDDSIRIHACHSPMREVQVLHDRLLDLFERLPDLEPRDLVVMAPDIDVYAPYVEAVFGGAPPDRRIPWSIADRARRAAEPLVQALMALLGLPDSRLTAPEVMGLLEVPAVLRRFGLCQDDLQRLRQWIAESGIRWGGDGSDRTALGLPQEEANTWAFGLRRLLLGYALPPGTRLFEGVAPLGVAEGADARCLGQLAEVVARLRAWRARLSVPQRPAAWHGLLNELLDDFLRPDADETYVLQALRDLIAGFAERAAEGALDRLLPLEVVRDHLSGELEAATGAHRFLAGQVTFCNMVPMRSIPFRVICLLGMNDQDYPRAPRPPGFDLMAAQPRAGDRSRREDDRYLFLEVLLSARERLYLSYVGRSVRDNAPLLPSALVSELLEYVERSAGVDARRALVTEHPLQPFSRRYFGPDPGLFSYAREWLAGARAAASGAEAERPFVPGPLPEPEPGAAVVELDELIRFFRHPARHFCMTRLGLALDEREEPLEDREPFVLDGLQGHGLRRRLLEEGLAGVPEGQARAALRASGLLPPGAAGDLELRDAEEAVRPFVGRLRALLEQGTEALEIDLELAGVRLTGWQSRRTGGGLLRYRPARLSAGDRLGLWIAHLAMCACTGPADSLHLASDLDLRLRPVERPGETLDHLIALYRRGLLEPLPLFPRTSWAYVSTLAARGDVERAEDEARKAWSGNSFSGRAGEGEDPWVRTAFRGRDPLAGDYVELARAVFEPLIAHAEEVQP